MQVTDWLNLVEAKKMGGAFVLERCLVFGVS